ncbi:MAG: hypothetical protein HC849_11070 [Oscillatoriales cyanobacterium RU_3_3]|nr:hypothetical protein [Microcoleus sp. SU_5_6]NJL68571.1 hypothetical protein [Microcoleus sp. SM1_3_4]NJM60613.1 hypothetical protein [Oscillatoriales cyanobacterium RU_3_3]NJR20876.1 hypothetical protein [Richelia sp. CSU_2_1]
MEIEQSKRNLWIIGSSAALLLLAADTRYHIKSGSIKINITHSFRHGSAVSLQKIALEKGTAIFSIS